MRDMDTIREAVNSVIESLYNKQLVAHIERPDYHYGDFATNVALQIAPGLGRPPREVAQELAEALQAHPLFNEVSVAGPGFINMRLTDQALAALVTTMPQAQLDGIHYVVEYSCPNAFKELHTGHLYQTVLGDMLCRLLEASGARVTRTSFGGDVGLHVARCLWGIVDTIGGEYPEKLDDVDKTPFGRARWISDCYVRGAAAYESSEQTKQAIDTLNKTIYEFHASDDHQSALAQIYWETRQWSFDYFEAFYKEIQVDTMRYYPESSTAPTGLEVVREQLAKGTVVESEGAVVFRGDETQHLHTRVFITSKGLPTYETKDIGVIWLERQEYQFDHRVLITGNDQKEYMRVVFAAAEIFDPSLSGTMTHITNGTVRFGDGKKMSSRLGNVARAIDVVNIVRDKVKELVSDSSLTDAVALGAIKYVFAKYRVGGDIAFDIDETVSLAGNSGPYIQYAHARACSILQKANQKGAPIHTGSFDSTERVLLYKLGEYTAVVEKATTEFAPHGICSYLYELAQTFNRFYEQSRIIGDEREAVRLSLVETYRDVLASGLAILGIEAVEKM